MSIDKTTAVTNAAKSGTGSILGFGGSSAPTGWLLCDGTAYNAVTSPQYQPLYDVIGITYGGTNNTNFKVPDLRGRTLIGSGTGTATGATNKTLGSTPTSGVGGEETHTLTSNEMASHNHGTSGDSHNHYHGQIVGATAYGNVAFSGGTGWMDNGGNLGNTSGSGTGVSLNANGSGTAYNIMSPYVVGNYIIKT